MRGLTILQPFASLICLPESDPRHKRVENRDWQTSYRGPLAIHAGLSKKMLQLGRERIAIGERGLAIDTRYGLRLASMHFGSIIAICRLVGCVRKDSALEWSRAVKRYLWLEAHMHAEGPVCLILADIEPLKRPVPCRGAQGLWEVPRQTYIDILKAQTAKVVD